MARSAGDVLLELLERVPDAATLEVLLEPANLAAILRAKGWQPDDIRADLAKRMPGELLLDVMRDEPDVDVLLRLAGARRPNVPPAGPASPPGATRASGPAPPVRASGARPTGLETTTLAQRIGGVTVLVAATVPSMFVSRFLPDAPRLGLAPALAGCAVVGAAGGLLFARDKAPPLAGAVCGALAAAGSVVATWCYGALREPVLRIELIMVVALGLVPGVVAYLAVARARA